MSTNREAPIPKAAPLDTEADTPEKCLIYAILERALKDYVGTTDTAYGYEKVKARRDAERWLFRATGPFSLAWCAQFLAEDPEAWLENVRAYARRMRAQPGAQIPSLWGVSQAARKKHARRKKIRIAS